MAFKLNKKYAGYILAGVAILIVGGIIWYANSRDDSDKDQGDNGDENGGGGGGNYCANPATLDKGKLLKKNMPKNPEVCYLQKLLGVKQDGIFGSITEGALDNKIGKKEITLFNYTACVQGGIC